MVSWCSLKLVVIVCRGSYVEIVMARQITSWAVSQAAFLTLAYHPSVMQQLPMSRQYSPEKLNISEKESSGDLIDNHGHLCQPGTSVSSWLMMSASHVILEDNTKLHACPFFICTFRTLFAHLLREVISSWKIFVQLGFRGRLITLWFILTSAWLLYTWC